jgi:hypothetical protein
MNEEEKYHNGNRALTHVKSWEHWKNTS